MAILRLDTGCNAYIPHIHIGREAENDVSQIDFVVQSWIDTYGDGGVSLAVQRYGDKEAYIVPLAIVDGVATWTISDTDTAKEGRGSVQLTYVVGEKVKKSQIYKIVVDSSLVGSDAVPDPYDNWLAILTEMTAQTGANADSARVSAQEAAKSEANAKASETNAKASETNAKASEEASAQSATSASASAVNASADAQRAETAEANAEESAANAKADADSAKADADRAEQAAATATAKAQEATQDAQTANTASQTATAKASEASASASTASTAATTATTKAQAASESATTAQTAQTSAQTAQGLAESARDNAITAKTDAESARDEAQDIADGITGKVEQIDSNTERIESLEDDRYKPYAVDTASGAVASFSDGADNLPMKSVKVDIEPLQDLHGYDAPWPAGGGKNLCPPLVPTTGTGLTITANSDGSLSVSGTATASGYITEFATLAQTIPSGTAFVLSIKNPVSARIRALFDSGVADIYEGRTSSASITRSDDVTKVRLYLFLTAGTAYNFTIHFQLEKGSTATSWTPYSNICPITGWTGCVISHSGADTSNPTTYPITFPSEAGTVYGGTLDVTKGKLVVDRAMVDIGTLTWFKNSGTIEGQSVFSVLLVDFGEGMKPRVRYTENTMISSQLLPCNSTIWFIANMPDNSMMANEIRFYVCANAYATAADFKTAMSGVQLCYELAEPIHYPITPTEIKTLLGENNVWADTGDSEVEYRADTKLYITKKITEAVSALS